MKQITILSASPTQKVKVILDDGSRMTLTLTYSRMQQGWFFDVQRNDFTVSGRRLVVGANLLRAFKEIIPFGIACFSADGYEPVFLEDFSSGRVAVYALNPADVVQAEAGIAAYV